MIGLEEIPIMKVFRISLFFALLVAVSLPAVAQTGLQVDIPFNFVAAGKSLPAGHYRVTRAFEMDQILWIISNGHSSLSIITNSVVSPGGSHRPSLVFWHSGEEYSLAQFWTDQHSGRTVNLKPRVKTTILAKSGKYVEIGAE